MTEKKLSTKDSAVPEKPKVAKITTAKDTKKTATTKSITKVTSEVASVKKSTKATVSTVSQQTEKIKAVEPKVSSKPAVTKETIRIEIDNKSSAKKEEPTLKVLFVASECQPFSATGGLGDVVGSLPKAIKAVQKDADVRVILPLYGDIKQEYRDQMNFIGYTTVELAWRKQYCGVMEIKKDGVTYYFIDNEYYFKREGQYGHYDDGERFAFFSKAALTILPLIGFAPDIIHANDWQTALLPVYLKALFHDEEYRKIRTIFTIHNIAYQGTYDISILHDVFGLDSGFLSVLSYDGNLNLMKGAIVCCDLLSTVSPTYASEIKTPEHSHGLYYIISQNAYKLKGIINGIDNVFYNPETDPALFCNYNRAQAEKKVENKMQLQQMLNLPVDANVPMVSIITRLVEHKGIDILVQSIDELMKNNLQLVVLGKGDLKYEDRLRYFEHIYPNKIKVIVAFNQDLSRKIYAASDLYLMPSKSEPCGLAQMIASRYGTIPIVREVGGLNDSIVDFGTGHGNGWTFKNYSAKDFAYVVKNALEVFSHHKESWADLRNVAFKSDFSWEKSAKEYLNLYKTLAK